MSNASTSGAAAAMPIKSAGFRLPALKELGLVVVVLLLGTGLSIFGYIDAEPGADNTFLNPANLVDQIATPMSYFAIMAVGMTFVIITGGIDISVGSTMAISGVAAASFMQRLAPETVAWKVLPVALLLGPIVGLCCGLLNGVLVVLLRMHPFIVTLGTMSILRGITVVAPPGQTVPSGTHVLPHAFTDGFMQREFGGLAIVPALITAAVVIVGGVYLAQTVGGREIYAVGGNEEAARFSGIRTNAVKLRVFAVAGLTAGIAGTVLIGRFGTISTNSATGYELNVIAAAVVGGASLTGGRGSAVGALLGALIIAMIEDAILILHLKQEYRLIIIGAAIVLAVAVDRFSDHLRVRRLAGARKI